MKVTEGIVSREISICVCLIGQTPNRSKELFDSMSTQ